MDNERKPLAKDHERDASRKSARSERLDRAVEREAQRRRKVGEDFLKNVALQRRYEAWNLFFDRLFLKLSLVFAFTADRRQAVRSEIAENLERRKAVDSHYPLRHDLARVDNAYSLRCLAEFA